MQLWRARPFGPNFRKPPKCKHYGRSDQIICHSGFTFNGSRTCDLTWAESARYFLYIVFHESMSQFKSCCSMIGLIFFMIQQECLAAHDQPQWMKFLTSNPPWCMPILLLDSPAFSFPASSLVATKRTPSSRLHTFAAELRRLSRKQPVTPLEVGLQWRMHTPLGGLSGRTPHVRPQPCAAMVRATARGTSIVAAAWLAGGWACGRREKGPVSEGMYVRTYWNSHTFMEHTLYVCPPRNFWNFLD